MPQPGLPSPGDWAGYPLAQGEVVPSPVTPGFYPADWACYPVGRPASPAPAPAPVTPGFLPGDWACYLVGAVPTAAPVPAEIPGFFCLDFTGIPVTAPVSAPVPSVQPPGFFPVDWTGVPGCPGTAQRRRAGGPFALDVREVMEMAVRREKERADRVRAKDALKLKLMADETTIRLAEREHAKRLRAARASYAVLLAEL